MTDDNVKNVINQMNASLPERKLLQLIDRTSLSADLKAILVDLAKITIQVGETVVSIGKGILKFVFELVKSFPNLTLGILVAVVLSTIISAVPVIGALFGGIIAPLLLAIGIGKGALADIADNNLKSKIEGLTNDFSDLEKAM